MSIVAARLSSHGTDRYAVSRGDKIWTPVLVPLSLNHLDCLFCILFIIIIIIIMILIIIITTILTQRLMPQVPNTSSVLTFGCCGEFQLRGHQDYAPSLLQLEDGIYNNIYQHQHININTYQHNSRHLNTEIYSSNLSPPPSNTKHGCPRPRRHLHRRLSHLPHQTQPCPPELPREASPVSSEPTRAQGAPYPP